ncbi:hypothetical protein MEN41_06690 [Dolichospermum sp. ST_con]|nr:hypothetical protein [Dolichospermum sp. ST_con]MDD1420205.1 hypothetical protein [Dolichospermum sp. ST_sed1]MDD1425815.1 hypothetical protein [Dolichospermum sp. ST_sed9]MDD1432249.1 hypothetical protein [Dolichospermum sp. ST_sed6]MDD1435138.1 hypothetical protein [Dolichospermum sp. ST_sed10]MDD1439850.1 hypothetical protein [Dolichospermum sp. ST_sed3]MDD1447467.1 hypothetical protein [Dolichospermum sp. ST_sed8]MDD1455170.1 hypothetical protein [Dolichospermum sp. ST_sed7]MDD146165
MSIKLIFSGRTHKENESINDCQDYFQINLENNCFAIADGASQSFYPSIWAELLVKHFCQNPNINKGNWEDWLQPIQEKWLVEVEQRVIKAKNENSPVWVQNQNRFSFREPATSTFIGLQFIGGKVTGSIVGDSCLFIVEGDQLSKKYQLIHTYLLKKSKDFNDCPGYFASYNKDNNFIPDNFQISLNQKKSQKDIYFILATDALSEYIFKCTENKDNIFEILLNISSSGNTFENFVASARNSDSIKMKNDDVTLLILSMPNTSIDQSSIKPIEKNSEVEDIGVSRASNAEYEQSDVENKIIYKSQSSHNKTQTRKKDDSVLINENLKLKKQNTNLKQQRGVLGLLGVFLLVFIVIDKINSTKVDIRLNPIVSAKPESKSESKPQPESKSESKPQPEYTQLKKGTTIYKDENLRQILIDSLYDSSQVLIVEKGNKWTKFKIDIYIHQNLITNNCNDCKGDEIETIATNKVINLRLKPNGDIFAELKNKSKFKKISFQANWYKFEFMGYVKK